MRLRTIVIRNMGFSQAQLYERRHFSEAKFRPSRGDANAPIAAVGRAQKLLPDVQAEAEHCLGLGIFTYESACH